MTTSDVTALEVIALDSMGSCILMLVILPIFEVTGIEDVSGAIYQIGHSAQLGTLMAVYVIVHALAQICQYVCM